MQARDKWIIAILIVLVALTGLTYYGFAYNETTVSANDSGAQTIVVNGNGSSGTGDVQNVQQVTQVQQVSPTTTKTVVVTQEAEQVTGETYTPES